MSTRSFGHWSLGTWLARTLAGGARAPESATTAVAPTTRSTIKHPSVKPIQRRIDVQRISAAVTRLQDRLTDRDGASTPAGDKDHHDALTGLHNRAYLALLSERLERPQVGMPMEFSVMCLDLDAFKPINERHGRGAGNQVLKQTATRLQHCAREQDLVFRLEDDRFLMLLPCPAGEGTALARAVAARVLHEVQRPVSYLTLSGLKVGCSVGGAIWQPGTSALAVALAYANEARRAAKQSGRGQFRQAMPIVQGAHASIALSEALSA